MISEGRIMKIILLGTGTTLPQKNRNAAGILIQIDGDYLLFDCGNGILRQIECANIDFRKIKTIFISHLHADHINDLPILLKANLMQEDMPTIRVFGPTGIKEMIKHWFTMIYSYLYDILKHVEIYEFNENPVEGRNWELHAFPVQHGIIAFGFKLVSKGKKIIYSGDTGVCEELIQIAQNADLLIHECSYPTNHKHGKGHTNPIEIGLIAKESNVKEVFLTHFYPVCAGHEQEFLDDIKKNYKGKVTIGQDLQEIIIE